MNGGDDRFQLQFGFGRIFLVTATCAGWFALLNRCDAVMLREFDILWLYGSVPAAWLSYFMTRIANPIDDLYRTGWKRYLGATLLFVGSFMNLLSMAVVSLGIMLVLDTAFR